MRHKNNFPQTSERESYKFTCHTLRIEKLEHIVIAVNVCLKRDGEKQ